MIDASRGEKLESWGGIVLRRPDPQIVWTVGKSDLSDRWRGADAHYIRSNTGGRSLGNEKTAAGELDGGLRRTDLRNKNDGL